MLTYTFERDGKTPLYEQLYNFIKSDIISGVIKGGEKLPSKRELAAHLGISKVTVEAAYGSLTDEGYINSIEKKGYYCEKNLAISPDAALRYEGKNHYSFPGNPDNEIFDIDLCSNSVPTNLFPFSVWAHLMREVISEYRLELLEPVPFNGAYKLRSAISRFLMSERGINISPECIFIGSGSEYLYTQITRLLGADKIYAVENPSHRRITEVYGMNNAHCVPLNLGKNGIDISRVEKSGADILHISPSHNFPTGQIMSAKARHDIISWANSGDRYIVEDDFDSELRFDGKPIPPLLTLDTCGRVIYINTFSKTISPSLRVGYMVLPDKLAERCGSLLSFNACTVPSLEQYTLAQFIEKGYFERHINRAKKYYQLLRSSLLDEYAAHGIRKMSELRESDAGLHFTLSLKTELTEKHIITGLGNRGIKASFISDYCRFGEETDPAYQKNLLINYSGINPVKFRSALDALKEILEGK